MEPEEKEIEKRLSELKTEEVRAYKRAMLYTLIPVLVGLIVLGLSAWGVVKLERSKATAIKQAEEARRDIEILETQKRDLEEQTKRIRVTLGPDSFNEQEIKSSVEGRRQLALNIAFNLYHRQPPVRFYWGGKEPDVGFDTSGFVTYILSQVNVLTKQDTYWNDSSKLADKFGSKNFKSPGNMKLSDFVSQELKPGDVIFYDNKLLMLYLGDDRCMGMLPTKGLVVTEVDFGFNIINIWKVPYEQ
ncbi:MAG TPA: NlpC/P60 family protein [Pyrinomonadaceae bacterium]|jgi:hypothetical protein